MSVDWDENMVILAREIGDSVVLNKTISITVLGMLGNKIRLGIDAPSSTIIERKDSDLRAERHKNYC